PHAIGGASDAPFDQVSHPKRATDVCRRHLILQRSREASGLDRQCWKATERVDDVSGYAFAEIVVCGVATLIGERQHCNRWALWMLPFPGLAPKERAGADQSKYGEGEGTPLP